MKKQYLFPALCVILIVLVSIPAYGYIAHRDAMTKNGIQWKKAVSAVQADEVFLNSLIPFDWDGFYVFFGPAEKEEMQQTMGIESGDVQALSAQGQSAVYIVKGDKIICRADGTAGAAVFVSADGGSPVICSPSDDARFTVTEENGRKDFILQPTEE